MDDLSSRTKEDIPESAFITETLAESKPHFRVTTRENPVDFVNDNSTDVWRFFTESISNA